MRALLLTLICIPITLFTQGTQYFSPVFDIDEVKVGLESIKQNDLIGHLSFLASNATEGRGTGEHGLQVAAEYIAAQFRRLGLTSLNPDGSYFQKYELLKTQFGEEPELALIYQSGDSRIKESFQYKNDFFLSLRGMTGSLEIQAPVVFCGYGITAPEYGYDDYANTDIKNKIVLVISGEPDLADSIRFKGSATTHFADIREKLTTAKDLGASALLVASNPKSEEFFVEKYNQWEQWLTRQTMTLPTSDRVMPLIIINEWAADRILSGMGTTLQELQAELESTGYSTPKEFINRYIRLKIDVKKETVLAQNVAGYLPGNDPEVGHETIIISAHYDHLGKNEKGTIWYGADDNGTGTSSILEIAEAVMTNPSKPKRGFLFLAVSGEEKGLLGSRYYTSHPLIPMKNSITDLNIDMVGRNAPDSIYIIGSDMISEDLHKVNEYALSIMESFEPNYLYNTLDDPNRFYYRSDHYNFAKKGIPIIFYFAGIHQDYHKPSDTVDKINFEKLQKVTRLVYLAGWGISQNGVRPRKNAGQYPEIPDQIKF